MSKKEKKDKKEKKQIGKKVIINREEADLYDDLPDGFLEAVSDEKLTSAYTALYITLFAFLMTVVIALFLMYNQYQMLAGIMNGTAVHIPAGADIESYSGSINAGTW